ncbi:MAG: SMC-Scp complex subunit ScpB [Nitrospirae bacterium]|nr:SMC-Scp complex subunit ScpB [Nitrospirota bacterium]
MELQDIKRIIEALLFVSPKPLTFRVIASFLDRSLRAKPEQPQGEPDSGAATEPSDAATAEAKERLRENVRQALLALEEEYKMGHGIVLTHIAGGYQFRTESSLGPWVQKFLAARPERLSRSALETLSIIAYKQPLTRAEAEHIRGVDCSGVLTTLLEKKLIRIAGKKEVPGHPLLYGTTREFLELFGLNELGDLPTLRQIEELIPKEGETEVEATPPPETLSSPAPGTP